MSRSVNKVIIIGNAAADAALTNTVCNLSIATSEDWKDKQTGDRQTRTEWHQVVFFGKVAEIAAEYIKKGDKIYVEGSLRTKKWTDKNNVTRYTTQIIGQAMQILSSRKQEAQQPTQAQLLDDEENGFDDDIPF